MKIKDIFKMIESYNKVQEFLKNYSRQVVVLDDSESRDRRFTNVKEFTKYFNKNFQGKITSETYIYNDDGFITFNVKYEELDYIDREFTTVTKIVKYNIYVETIQKY